MIEMVNGLSESILFCRENLFDNMFDARPIRKSENNFFPHGFAREARVFHVDRRNFDGVPFLSVSDEIPTVFVFEFDESLSLDFW